MRDIRWEGSSQFPYVWLLSPSSASILFVKRLNFVLKLSGFKSRLTWSVSLALSRDLWGRGGESEATLCLPVCPATPPRKCLLGPRKHREARPSGVAPDCESAQSCCAALRPADAGRFLRFTFSLACFICSDALKVPTYASRLT